MPMRKLYANAINKMECTQNAEMQLFAAHLKPVLWYIHVHVYIYNLHVHLYNLHVSQ